MKNQKGITLIALVITIIVLIILTGVAINLSIGENGIFRRAEEAKLQYEIAQAKEELDIKIAKLQAEKQGSATLQDIVDMLKQEDMNYVVSLEELAAVTGVEVIGEVEEIYIIYKIYQFKINNTLETEFISIIDYEDDDADDEEEITDKNSTIIGNVTFEIVELNATSMKVKVNVETDNVEDIKGYLIYVNQEVVHFGEENNILVENLENGTTYNIKCGVIDKEGKIKLSDEKTVTTKKNIYDGTNFSNGVTSFAPFRVDTASGYTAYAQYNGLYKIIGLNKDGRAGVNTTEKVNLTDVKTIEIDTKMYNNYGSSFTGTAYLGIYTESDSSLDFTKSVQYSTNAINSAPESKKMELDVSDITGEYYIKVIAVHPSNVSNYGFIIDIYSIDLELNKEETVIKNNQENGISSIVSGVSFETLEVKDTSMKIQINPTAQNLDDVRGYYIYANDEIVAVNSESLVTVQGLENGTVYNIKCGIIDKDGNIKESEERKIATLTSEVLYDGTNYPNRITGFAPFRVDTASGYTAYKQSEGLYQIQALNNNGRTGVNTTEKVDLTNIKTIEIDAQMYNNYGSSFTGTLYLGIYTEADSSLNFTKSVQYSTNALAASPERQKIELDVSDITGEYYIKVISVHPSGISYHAFVVNIYSMSLKLETAI